MCPRWIQGIERGSPYPRPGLKVKEEGDIWSQFGLQSDSAGCRLTGIRSILAAGPQQPPFQNRMEVLLLSTACRGVRVNWKYCMNQSCDAATPTLIILSGYARRQHLGNGICNLPVIQTGVGRPPPCCDGNQGKHIELSEHLFCVEHIAHRPANLLLTL